MLLYVHRLIANLSSLSFWTWVHVREYSWKGNWGGVGSAESHHAHVPLCVFLTHSAKRKHLRVDPSACNLLHTTSAFVCEEAQRKQSAHPTPQLKVQIPLPFQIRTTIRAFTYAGSDVKGVGESPIFNAHGLDRGYRQITSKQSWTHRNTRILLSWEVSYWVLVVGRSQLNAQMLAKFML